MRSHTRFSLGAGLFALALMATGVGVLSPSAMADDAFKGVVVDDKVDILAGASPTFYTVGQAQRGMTVRVEEVISGWNKIDAPAGVFSYISKGSVDLSDDKKTATVKAEKTSVFAANVKGPSDSFREQTKLVSGTVVNVVAEEGAFYKITPPAGTFVYLKPGAVRRADLVASASETEKTVEIPKHETPKAAEAPSTQPAPVTHVRAPRVQPVPAPIIVPASVPIGESSSVALLSSPEAVASVPETPATQPSAAAPKPHAHPAAAKHTAPKPAEPVVASESATDSSSTPEPVQAAAAPSGPVIASAKAESVSVRALEAKLAATRNLPLEKQPLAELLSGYEAASKDDSLPNIDRKIVAIRLPQIRRAAQIAATLKTSQQVQANSTSVITVPAIPAPAAPGVYKPSDYDAFGQLLASGVYDGDNGPRLYRLVDPVNSRTIVYVIPSNKVDAPMVLGRLVGIIGTPRFDPSLRLQVIEVKRMDILEATGAATAVPAANVVAPSTQPAGQ